jgi:DNA-binding IclR family transcriptional regulator
MINEPISSTLHRVFSIIELFLTHPEGFTPQTLLDETQIPRSTLFTLLKSLKELGYLIQNESRGRYLAGPRLSAWSGSNTPSYQNLLNAFNQETYQQGFDETIALAVPTTSGILVLEQVESQQKVRAVYNIGEPLPSDSAAHQILSTPISQQVLQEGYTVVTHLDGLELAFPICSDGITPSAFLLLSAPAFRWQTEHLLNVWQDKLRFMAARLSYRLGALIYTPFQNHTQPMFQNTVPLDNKVIDQFLQGPWAARLACIRPDGNPHVIPVWQEWDGSYFYILAWQGSQWADYLRKNPQVSLTIDEPWLPLRRIVCRGEGIELKNDNPGQQMALLSRLTRRYLGQSAPILFQQQVDTIFKVKPESLKGWMGIPGGPG